jgi:hypothetical protein
VGRQHVDRDVAGDGQQPRGHGSPARIEGGGVPPGPDERLLGCFFGRLAILQYRQGHPEHPALKPVHERRCGIGVSRAQPHEQGFV